MSKGQHRQLLSHVRQAKSIVEAEVQVQADLSKERESKTEKPLNSREGSRIRRIGPWRLLEFLVVTAQLTLQAVQRGWEVSQPILSDTYDLRSREGRDQMRKYVIEYDPELIVIDLPKLPVPMGGPPMKQRAVAERRKTLMMLLSMGDELLQWHTSRGAVGIMLAPVK